ncbi:hypothetical protein [Faecalispora anaeroviscerum]|uniref:hypothetical protein n=1 Tax=Faecalispora anaeroviscerum TaxID=2991836 RepID=UPI0024B8DD64|nr:hypothetical protein [Faecalispora anaeroviscerum]
MNRLQELVSAPNGINCYEVNLIRIVSYHNREMQGLFYSPYCKRSASFLSELELLNLLNRWMDSEDIPQSTTQLRKFSKKSISKRVREGSPVKYSSQNSSEVLTTAEDWSLQEQPESGATFIVQVTMRQSATWQGVLQRTDTNQVRSFHSTLELLLLLTSALEGSLSSPWNDEPATGNSTPKH